MRLLCVILCANLFLCAEISEKQKHILMPHITTIIDAIPVLEKEIDTLQEKYISLSLQQETLVGELEIEDSLLQKGVLKTKLAYYNRQVKKYKTKVEKKRENISMYYGILVAFDHHVSVEKIIFAKKFITNMQEKQQKIISKIKKIDVRRKKAENRKQEIPIQQQKVQSKVDEFMAKHKILVYKKSWSNLAERTKIMSQVSYQKTILAKLLAEEILQDKIISDCIQEKKSLIIQQTELEVAVQELSK